MINIVWFRNDLRIHDNPSLLAAEKQDLPLLCIYILPEIQENFYELGFSSIGSFRKRFLLESLVDLNENLKKKGASLYILKANSRIVFEKLCEPKIVNHVYFQAEIAWNERKEEQEITQICKNHGTKVIRHFNSVLYNVNSLPFELKQTPDVFTQFRKQVETHCTIQIDLPEPTQFLEYKFEEEEKNVEIKSLKKWLFSPENYLSIEAVKAEIQKIGDVDKRTAFPFKGGENFGKQRIEEYLFETDALASYKETRNGFIGLNYSSKFSSWLAMGCVSPRYVMREVNRYENEKIQNESTYWLFVELLWREYWRYIFFKHERAYFYRDGISETKKVWKKDTTLFENWRLGKTGFPLIDANMRELLETGWMSNRGRQIVASFLAKNVVIDWRWGAAWFESQLIDYDVYSNWGNWAYVSGVGNDGRDRYFNLIIQAKKYDTKGEFMKLWCPELAKISGETLGVLHQLSEQERLMFGLDEVDYPHPMIDYN